MKVVEPGQDVPASSGRARILPQSPEDVWTDKSHSVCTECGYRNFIHRQLMQTATGKAESNGVRGMGSVQWS